MVSVPNFGRYDIQYFNSKVNNIRCIKDHGSCHEQAFVSISDFSTSTIAKFCEERKLLELVEAIIKLTVRITVKHASLERSEITSIQCYKYNDKYGSGTVLELSESQVHVLTAKHVVSNSEGSKNTECWLYFDGNSCKKIIIKGLSESDSNISKDWCDFTCEIDEKEIEKLHQSLREYEQGLENLNRNKMKRHKKCIIVSHPHGCYKYVSMGSCELDKHGYLTYKAPTCSGSSGGYIIPIGCRTEGVFIHSGSREVEGVSLGQSSGEVEQYRPEKVEGVSIGQSSGEVD
ncbi:hypothetical protein Bpfe_023765 [Biomphalaria pfeifferi]|uniref:Peptidase S1 domain-containing protein n=1 Tax=Biomphalaria pfeifferi TaxID=112525 RepID=A0AAD8B2E4_BIOPF|nr:hypothetical protein Bpfe_023765 [Biomphalaria pfeifferi]